MKLPNAEAGVQMGLPDGAEERQHGLESGRSLLFLKVSDVSLKALGQSEIHRLRVLAEGFFEARRPRRVCGELPVSRWVTACLALSKRTLVPSRRSSSRRRHRRSACASVRPGASSRSSADTGKMTATCLEPRMRTTCSPRSAAFTRALRRALASRIVTAFMVEL